MARLTGFGPKNAWLAIRGEASPELIDALAIGDAEEIPWADADEVVDDPDRVLIYPTLPGVGGPWTLIAGIDADEVPVGEISAALGGAEVQFFATHRVVEFHAWQRARGGVEVRRAAYLGEAGEVRAWTGAADADEQRLGVPAGPVSEGAIPAGLRITEDTVLELAGAWSINPLTLDDVEVDDDTLPWAGESPWV